MEPRPRIDSKQGVNFLFSEIQNYTPVRYRINYGKAMEGRICSLFLVFKLIPLLMPKYSVECYI